MLCKEKEFCPVIIKPCPACRKQSGFVRLSKGIGGFILTLILLIAVCVNIASGGLIEAMLCLFLMIGTIICFVEAVNGELYTSG